jgi:hypothetical protein
MKHNDRRLTVKEKAERQQDQEVEFRERPKVVCKLELLVSVGQVGGDGEHGNSPEPKDQESAGSHRPCKADLWKEVVDHEGKDYTTQTRTCNGQSSCQSAALFEVSHRL